MTSTAQAASLTSLPRELRDEIINYLARPGFVYTSGNKPSTANLRRGKDHAATFVDTRIFVPCRIPPNALGVCRQLRQDCLLHHTHTLNSLQTSPSTSPSQKPPQDSPYSSIIIHEQLDRGSDEETERRGDHGVRITIEAQRQQRGQDGYYEPVREELSPRFLALLPLLERSKTLRLVVWPGYNWWNGSRPRAVRRVNGRLKLEIGDSDPTKPDAVSVAIGKILARLPAVEELRIDVMIYAADMMKWDLPFPYWKNIQSWLDGPVARQGGAALKKVSRKLVCVWNPQSVEAFYEQEEMCEDNKRTWQVKRKGDMRMPTLIAISDEGIFDEYDEVVDETLERTD